MAKYIAQHGRILEYNADLGRTVDKLDSLATYGDVPLHVAKEIRGAIIKINKVIIQLQVAGRHLIEADVDESMKEKEVDHEG